MPGRYQLTTEMFAIPCQGDAWILYSPLKQLLMLANEDMVSMVAALRDGTFERPTGENLDALQLLIESGAVNGRPDEPPSHRESVPWKPTEVTLFLTNACNLRCSYCYASAGDYKGSMDLPTALSAIELVAANARELRRDGFRVSFHGGGEPTLAWDTLVGSVERSERLAEEHGLAVSLNLATNGVLPDWKVDWLARRIDEFSISYDGPGHLHDKHRPTVAGRGSAETVEATFRHLDSHEARYGIRATITRDSVHHLAEIVEYILQRFSPNVIHVEPVFSQGRARDRGLGPPEAEAFIDNYRRAEDIAESHGMALYYSGARSELITDTFCGVPDGSFNVTPEGLLTSCFEVCHPEDELADQFFYGSVSGKAPPASEKRSASIELPILDQPPPRSILPSPEAAQSAGGFVVDEGKIRELAGHTVRKRPECENCYCKWHCAGDCIAKNMMSDRRPEERLKSARCTINQALTRDQLIRRLKAGSRVMRQADLSGASQVKNG